MNQYQKRIIAGVVVAIAIVSALYIPMHKSPVVHTAYASLLLAALLAGASLWQLSRTTARDYITGLAFPLALKSYLTTTVSMAVLFVTLDLTGIWSISLSWYASLQIIVIGLTAWKLLAIGAGTVAIHQVEEYVHANVSNWKLIQADVEAILRIAPSTISREVSAVRDLIKYADPMSKAEVAPQEQEIAMCLKELRYKVQENKADEAKAICTRIRNAVNDRANRLKILK